MTLLAGFLDVVVRGIGLVAFSAAVGGVAFALLVLRPFSRDLSLPLLRRSLRLIVWGGVGVAVTQLMSLLLQLAALGPPDGWPILAFVQTEFAAVATLRVFLAVALAAAVRGLLRHGGSRAGWSLVALLTVLLAASSGWLSHALGRLENRNVLAALDAVHQLSAGIWVGGLIHLAAFWLLWRRAGDLPLADRVLRRFSALALGAVGGTVAAGAVLALSYIDSLPALLGTGYGVMVLTKLVVLATALVLGGLNFLGIRRLQTSDRKTPRRVFVLVEAEIGLGVTILLAAASLTSLPPAVDVREDRATVAEVASRFLPRLPRLTSPEVERLLAVAAPITDAIAPRQAEEKAWSEYNHHMAGLAVLALGLLAVLHQSARAPWARHWPLGFLGLAAFLFVRNDPRAWPLGPTGFWESMLLPDVLQHRMAVLLIIALAVFEWMVRTAKLRSPGWAYVFPLLCAAGGGLLLTHSHAMFNLRAEFLVEVSHSPLGILGVFIGWGRWLELRLPEPENRIPGRLWAVCMVLMGGLLLTYREA